jgi:hypothetical protein
VGSGGMADGTERMLSHAPGDAQASSTFTAAASLPRRAYKRARPRQESIARRIKTPPPPRFQGWDALKEGMPMRRPSEIAHAIRASKVDADMLGRGMADGARARHGTPSR